MKREYYLLVFFVFLLLGVAYLVLFSKPSYEPGEMEEHIRGNHNAPVMIAEFSDFQCPYCGAVQPALEQLLVEYPEDVKLIYRHFPLPSHQYAKKAAEASECAADQEKFWEYHDLLFQNQENLDTNSLKGYAKQLELNSTSFNACLDSGAMSERVDVIQKSGLALGIQGTPTFIINGKMVYGNQPYSVFKSEVEKELSKNA